MSDLFNTLMEGHVAIWEGGFSDDPSDRGGATKYGITLATLRDFHGNPNLTKLNVQRLTREEADQIFRTRYWKPLNPDTIPNGLLALVFDAAINSGTSRAIKQLQQVLNDTKMVSLKVDGVMGARSGEAIKKIVNAIGEDALQDAYFVVRDNFYQHLVDNSASQSRFLGGWKRRLRACARMAARLSVADHH